MAAVVTVKLVWGKTTYEAVSIDKSAGVSGLRAAIYSLTCVPADRQKVMSKVWKGTLKDDADLLGLPDLKDGVSITLMGSADTAAAAPINSVPTFLEDMSAVQRVQAGVSDKLPAGLANLGNTCYANSVLQCIRSTPQLRQTLTAFRLSGTAGATPTATVSTSLSKLLDDLDASPAAVQPHTFLNALRAAFPKFQEASNPAPGVRMYKQQDADEFVGALLTSLADSLRMGVGEVQPAALQGSDAPANIVDSVLGLQMRTELKCVECTEEPPVVRMEAHRRLQANIDGGGGKTTIVNHLNEGISLGLKGDLEKRSEILGRNAIWNKTSRITRLPPVLMVQMVRFYWKRLDPTQTRDNPNGGVPCKILKPVSFPSRNLDLVEFCDDSVKNVLQDRRRAQEAAKEGKPLTARGSASTSNAAAGARAGASLEASMFGPGLRSNFTGLYELYGVVSHKGRDSSSGHYIGWVRSKGDKWLVYDDDSVEETDTETVTSRLKGGGDDFMAYILLYRAQQ